MVMLMKARMIVNCGLFSLTVIPRSDLNGEQVAWAEYDAGGCPR